MSVEVSVLIDYHHGLRAGSNVHVGSLLNFRRSAQLDISIGSSVNSMFGTTNGMTRRATIWVGPVTDNANISVRDRFL